MHARGWRSIYCMPKRPAFKGSAPINLSDRLNQVLRWALGSVEILFSRHCPIWYGYSGRLKWLERFAYVNTTIYPVTAIPLLMYCTLPAVCLLTNKFIIPQVCLTFYPRLLDRNNLSLQYHVSLCFWCFIRNSPLAYPCRGTPLECGLLWSLFHLCALISNNKK